MDDPRIVLLNQKIERLLERFKIEQHQASLAWEEWYEARQILKYQLNVSKEFIHKHNKLKKTVRKIERKMWNISEKIIDLRNRISRIEGRNNRKLGIETQIIKETGNKLKYNDPKYSTPEAYENKYRDKSAFIIAPGTSTKKLLKYRDQINNRFDVIIGINGVINGFLEQLDFHLIMDRVSNKNMYNAGWFVGNYRKDLPRILNFKATRCMPKDLETIIKTKRCNFGGKPHIRKYQNNNDEGLLIGPINRNGFAIGTPVAQTIHFAGILGCSKIYLIGADLYFKGDCDHFYEDRLYRGFDMNYKPRNISLLVRIDHKGEKRETLEYFVDSAEYLNEVVINQMCKENNIEVYDFSDGLITSAKQLNIDEFFNI